MYPRGQGDFCKDIITYDYKMEMKANLQTHAIFQRKICQIFLKKYVQEEIYQKVWLLAKNGEWWKRPGCWADLDDDVCNAHDDDNDDDGDDVDEYDDLSDE